MLLSGLCRAVSTQLHPRGQYASTVHHIQMLSSISKLSSRISELPDEVHKVGNQAVQYRVLYVEQPAIKAVEACNVGQLQCSRLCTLLCPQQQLTQDRAGLPLCDERPQYLQCTAFSMQSTWEALQLSTVS